MRLAVAALAVVVAAFFGARLHDHDRCEDARGRRSSAPRSAARRVDPDGDRPHPRARAAARRARLRRRAPCTRRGDDEQAAPLAREATRDEPDNAAAWRALAETAQAPAEARAAERRLRDLDPAGAPLLGSLNRSAGRSTR